MTQTNIATAGIDTSKLKFDIAVHGRTGRWQLANTVVQRGTPWAENAA
jgi:transposase